MNADTVIAALALPDQTRVDQRVPKKLLMENGAPTAADRRLIQDGVEEIRWIAALKPTTTGIPAFRDDTRDYLEIAVLTAGFRAGAKSLRLTELIHRAIPYPVFFATDFAGEVTVSAAHLRFAQGTGGGTVLEDAVSCAALGPEVPGAAAFLASLPLSAQPAQSLFTIYHGWLERITALRATQVTGSFIVAESPGDTADRRAALAEYARLTRDLTALRLRAGREKQLNRRVELNLDSKRVEASLAALLQRLIPSRVQVDAVDVPSD